MEGVRATGSVSQRLADRLMQASGWILAVKSQSFPSLDQLSDVGAKWVTGVQMELHSCDPQERYIQNSFGYTIPFNSKVVFQKHLRACQCTSTQHALMNALLYE